MEGQRGAGLLLAALGVLGVIAALLAMQVGAFTAAGAQRDRASDRALAQAREALIAYAAERPIDPVVGPGYLPCPDLDDDGWAESTCGSLSGHLGQEQRLGRLPWKTLGLPDLRDGYGERLWYAVSSRHKGLLNCAASTACVEHTPATALGAVSVRDNGGGLLQDGTRADPRDAANGGAVAVVIAPGAALQRADAARTQQRDCRPGECDALGRCLTDPPRRAARCDPANYLDIAPGARFAGEDNADFHDRDDAAGRAGNSNGFIHGPVVLPGGSVAVNDRLAVVGYNDVMPRVMARVAAEAALCVDAHFVRAGAYPAPAPACPAAAALGRIPDEAMVAGVQCAAGLASPAWWPAWRPFVLLALGAEDGLEVVDAEARVIARGKHAAILVTQAAGDCAGDRISCGAGGCTRMLAPRRGRDFHEAAVVLP